LAQTRFASLSFRSLRVVTHVVCETDPDKFLAGAVNGTIGLYSVQGMQKLGAAYRARCEFAPFPDLTSVNSNCDDTYETCPARPFLSPLLIFPPLFPYSLCLVSGYSTSLSCYDIPTGKLLHRWADVHEDNMNVVKFGHLSPWLFATSSTDFSIKIFDMRVPSLPDNPILHGQTDHTCLMVVFSPDDRFVLSSSEDNEIRQWNVAQRQLEFEIDHLPKRKNGENYSRSYYMNRGQYIITGSCDQSQIFVTSSLDGRLIREVELADIKGHPASAKSVYCQSLRGDPMFPNRFSVISSYDSRDERGMPQFRLVSVELGAKELIGD
jgi:WD40 repeat protein